MRTGCTASVGRAGRGCSGHKESLERRGSRMADGGRSTGASAVSCVESLAAARSESQHVDRAGSTLANWQPAISSTARDRVADRLREDYQIDLAAEYAARRRRRADLSGTWDVGRGDEGSRGLAEEDPPPRQRQPGIARRAGRGRERGRTTCRSQIADLTEAEQSLCVRSSARSTRTARSSSPRPTRPCGPLPGTVPQALRRRHGRRRAG